VHFDFRETCIQICSPQLTASVSLCKLQKLSTAPFPHLCKEDDNFSFEMCYENQNIWHKTDTLGAAQIRGLTG
jgi:hypothetical protein